MLSLRAGPPLPSRPPPRLTAARPRVQVLTTGSWPTQTAAKCNLPRELESCCAQFQAYYLRAHSGRKLTWQTNMGNADLKARTLGLRAWGLGLYLGARDRSRQVDVRTRAFGRTSGRGALGQSSGALCRGCPSLLSVRHNSRAPRRAAPPWLRQVNFATKRHELNVSTYQMCILLLFNEAERLPYRDIQEATQIAPAELKRNLQSLACVKVRPAHERAECNAKGSESGSSNRQN